MYALNVFIQLLHKIACIYHYNTVLSLSNLPINKYYCVFFFSL